MKEEIKIVETYDFWKEHSDAWKLSGLTQLKYCEQEGINYPSFVYQHTKLNQKPKSSSMRFIKATTEATNTYIPIQPEGIRIGVTNEANIGFLQKLHT